MCQQCIFHFVGLHCCCYQEELYGTKVCTHPLSGFFFAVSVSYGILSILIIVVVILIVDLVILILTNY